MGGQPKNETSALKYTLINIKRKDQFALNKKKIIIITL